MVYYTLQKHCMQSNCHLTELHIVDLICVSENDSALTKMLHMNMTLAHLHLSSIGRSDSGARYIFQGLQQNATTTHLNLASNEITGCEDTTQALTTMLRVNTSLTHLDLSQNVHFSSGAHSIIKTLQHNATLVHLDLSLTGMYNY